MKTIKHLADSRGSVNFGWLDSKHTFSFGRYFNPERMNFGQLRVLNDDIVEAGMGFGEHPHDNMEIVSIPLDGNLAHKDSTGREEVIKTGDVQIMSAGSGLSHSEYNHSKTDRVNFLQIWVMPKEKNITPRYQQITYDEAGRKNQLQTVVAPDDDSALWINQDAWFSLIELDSQESIEYQLHKEGNGVYTFVIEGSIDIGGDTLGKRDAMGISEINEFEISANANAKVLFIEVPMN
ncbi:MAG: pirin family protein [Cyclobacteriaceae bacterium]